MAASKPLEGLDLIDCAKANAPQGSRVAAEQCGYGSDLEKFMTALKQAADHMGVEVKEIEDLITDQSIAKRTQGIEVAPETKDKL
ncbi:hypothetical protein IQ241_09870 [Romeria aff. gracilis LEGE 07310]|uniref:Uncharacterized protein n=1 Tax=Vasconcelosia minhoensis LEGE 07310 TaxID=915328 RepID=A0A8J7DN30_9CYAN|nr:hypothetical protein [Romeria gracilis]MBE9077600.1 hypothetical protein [Romeria aff. gracilis LEGE 07310]